jgi:hypothetical protein
MVRVLSNIPSKKMLRLKDVVMEYAYARSDHRIEAADFDPTFHDASIVGATMGHLTKQMPWILTTMTSLPDWVTILLSPDMASYVNLQRVFIRSINFHNHKLTKF